MVKKILSNVLIIVVLLGIVLVATIYSDAAKQKVFDLLHVHNKQVLGIQVIGQTVDPTQKQKEVSQQVSDFVSYQVDLAKKQALNIKISDVINTLNQSKKIVRDLQTATNYAHNQIVELQKQIPALTHEKH